MTIQEVEQEEAREEVSPIEKKLNSLRRHVENAALMWLKEHDDPMHMQRFVRDLLERELKQFALNLIGVERRFDGWEVKRHDGQNGDTLARSWLQAQAKEHATKWFEEFIKSELPTPSSAMLKAFVKQYNEEYSDQLRRQLKELAQEKAHEDAARVFSEITGTPLCDVPEVPANRRY